MPPDDTLFSESTPKSGDQSQNGSAQGTPQDGQSGAQDAADITAQFETAAEKAFGPLFQNMASTLQTIEQRLSTLEQSPGDDETQNQQPSSDAETELVNDPSGFVETRAKKAAAEVVAPLFQNIAEDKFNSMEASVKAEVDQQFGEGAFDEIFREDARRVISSLPVEMRASENHYRSAINGIKGMKWNDLQARFSKTKEAHETEQRRNQFRPLDGGRSRPGPGQLSEEEVQYLGDLSRHGIEYSREEYIRDREAKKTASDFPQSKEATN